MNNGDFDLIFRQILDEFVVELVKIVNHDVFVFVARVEKGSGMILVFVELEIVWGLGEAENIDIFVFIDGIIENLDVIERVELFDEGGWVLWIPFFGFVWAGTVKIVIAERNEHWGDLAEAQEPGEQTF